jgi:hypothetical protein
MKKGQAMAIEFDELEICDTCNHFQSELHSAETQLYIRNQALTKAISWLRHNAVGPESKDVIAGMQGALEGKIWRDENA